MDELNFSNNIDPEVTEETYVNLHEMKFDHFLSYLSIMMDCLDRNGLHGYYLVMDNAPIYKPVAIKKIIERRGYKCVYLSPYSPFLNPIEEFWSKVKAGIKRNSLDTADRLIPRIMDAVTHVTL